MITQILLKDFIYFLRVNNAYTAYRHNIILNKPNLFFEVEKRGEEELLQAAFCWSVTKEGYDYWAELHNKWLIKLYEQKGNMAIYNILKRE